MHRDEAQNREGVWFSVPLEGTGIAIGIIARDPGGVLVLGYFFGPRRREPARSEDIGKLRAEDAILITTFYDRGVVGDKWSLVGRCENWNRCDWPVPLFARRCNLGGFPYCARIAYSDELTEVKATHCRPDSLRGLPSDTTCTPVGVAKKLSRLLGSTSRGERHHIPERSARRLGKAVATPPWSLRLLERAVSATSEGAEPSDE